MYYAWKAIGTAVTLNMESSFTNDTDSTSGYLGDVKNFTLEAHILMENSTLQQVLCKQLVYYIENFHNMHPITKNKNS
jgi:hypothetical protein